MVGLFFRLIFKDKFIYVEFSIKVYDDVSVFYFGFRDRF